MFKVTKRFTGGLLKGLEVEETTSVRFNVGEVYQPWGGSPYVVVAVEVL
jgi:hypothetical protein